jgi:transposase
MHRHIDKIKHSKYALGKNEENLTDRQHERLSMIASEDRQIDRAHKQKESLRKVFKLNNPELAEEYLEKWISRAQRCRIPAFVELQRKIRRNRTSILNTVRIGLSNARIEAINNKIKRLIRIAYGLRNIDTLISFVMLFCSQIKIPWPRNNFIPAKIKGQNQLCN